VTGGWRKQQNGFHNLYFSINIWAIKSRMRWVGHVTHMEVMKNAYKILIRRPEDQGTDGRMILKWIHPTQDRDRWRAFVNTTINL
jgi:hypothetical protein